MAPLLGQDPPYDADWLQLQMNEEDDDGGGMMNTATTSQQPQPKDTSFGSSGWDCGWEPCWEEAFLDTENLFSCSAAENVFSGGACGGTSNIGSAEPSPSPRANPFDENVATASKNSAINNNNKEEGREGRNIVVEPVALQVATDIDNRSVTNKSVTSYKSFKAQQQQQQQQQQQVVPAPPVSQVSFDKETNETQSIARSQITTANYSAAAPKQTTFYDNNDDEDTAATEPTHNCSPCSYTKDMYSMLRELKIACGKCDRECHNIMVSGTYQCCNILDTLCSDAFWIPGGTSGTKKNF